MSYYPSHSYPHPPSHSLSSPTSKGTSYIKNSLPSHSPSMTSVHPSSISHQHIHPEYPYPPGQYDQQYPPSSSSSSAIQPRQGLPKSISFPHWQIHSDADDQSESHQQPPYHQYPPIPPRSMSDQPLSTTQEISYSPHPVRATTFPPTHEYPWSENHDGKETYPQPITSRIQNTPEKKKDNEINQTGSKKRPRQISIPININQSSSDFHHNHNHDHKNCKNESISTPIQTTFWQSKPPPPSHPNPSSTSRSTPVTKRQNSSSTKKESNEIPKGSISIPIPSVLVRDKKQKACSNCRKAKLKCILEQGQLECIRCKSRKENCIFFPRSQDDEAQQKIVRDLYEATNHLSHLSKAVHHILHNLTVSNLIPPFITDDCPDGLETYDPPERLIPTENGNKHNLLGKTNGIQVNGNEGREKRRRVGKKSDKAELDSQQEQDELEEEEANDSTFKPSPMNGELTPTGSSTSSSIPSVLQAPNQVSSYTEHPNQSLSSIITRPPSTIVSSPPPPSARLPPPLIPPNRPSSRSPPHRVIPATDPHMVPPSISQVLSSGNQGWNIGQPPPAENEVGRPSFRNRMSSPPRMITGHDSPSYELPVTHNRDRPASATINGDATSMVRMEQPVQNVNESQIILLNPSPKEEEDHPDNVIGSQDPRPNIVKKGLVTPKDALALVKYFHQSLSPLIYGYPLQFYKFPYISGPKFITPLLLAVLCLISSERISQTQHFKYHRILAEEVTNLLQTSPAESWQRFEGGYTADFGDPDGDEPLDAEFGLGPEEIVASCILATYMTEREQASVIARSAFRWARGWIKLLKSSTPRFTIAASVGFVPPERQATDFDMARIWLLCYIVDSTERLQLSLDAPPLRDALSYCSVLIPSTSPNDAHNPYHKQDILLTFHARLMVILNEWRHSFKSLISASQPPSELVEELKNLVSNVNENLVWWKSTSDNLIRSASHTDSNDRIEIGQTTTQHVLITYYFVKMSVNSTLSKYLPSSPYFTSSSTSSSISTDSIYYSNQGSNSLENNRYDNNSNNSIDSPFSLKQKQDYNLKIEIKKIILESAIKFMKICSNWFEDDQYLLSTERKDELIDQRKNLSNLSPTYLFFVTLMGSELVEIVKESKENGLNELEIKADDIIPLLKLVGEMLFLGELNEQHVSRTTAKTLFVYCEKLQQLR